MAQLIYGIHPVQEALRSSPSQFEKIFVAAPRPHPGLKAVVDLAHQKQVPVTLIAREELDRIARGGLHQNIVGVVQEFSYADLSGLLTSWREKKTKGLLLILDGIQDPQNLGSLIRTAAGIGADGMIIPKDRAVGVTPVVVRASAGATAHLPVVRVVNIAQTIDVLKEEGFWVYGAEGEARDPVYELDLTLDLAVVIGSEGKGIRPLVRKKCDRLFSIPMAGPISSFNASVSGGMILYEVMRQRHTTGKEKK
jgi:23S rRNA (guanosine2251-2'-O)-methyltransferase